MKSAFSHHLILFFLFSFYFFYFYSIILFIVFFLFFVLIPETLNRAGSTYGDPEIGDLEFVFSHYLILCSIYILFPLSLFHFFFIFFSILETLNRAGSIYGNPEIGNFEIPGAADQDVGGLYVPVYY